MGRLSHLNVGTWPDTGANPKMTEGTADALVDWAFAAVTTQALKGRRVVIFGHDSMGMETALAHVIPTRKQFGIEITRLDMKLLADMLAKKAYDAKELKALRGLIDKHVGKRLEIRDAADSERFDTSLAMYLVMRDLLADLNAVGGGFMSQLEWGSDVARHPAAGRRRCRIVLQLHLRPQRPQGPDSVRHRGRRAGPAHDAVHDLAHRRQSAAVHGLPQGLGALGDRGAGRRRLGVKLPKGQAWAEKGLVDGDNSGSASLDWAAKPGASVDEIMKGVGMPLADPGYFPGVGNSVTFVTPGGLEGIAGRMAYSSLSGMFSLIWDEAVTAEVPAKLAKGLGDLTTPSWPHTWVVPKYASMDEYKQYPPANHFHMIQGLSPARLEYWMDLNNVLSQSPWSARPRFIEGVDRPTPLLYLANGGEDAAKKRLAK